MKLAEAITVCYKKYAVISGRATRSEFWWFALYAVIITVGIFLTVFFLTSPPLSAPSEIDLARGLTQFTSLANLLTLPVITIPLVAVASRRLHDVGRSAFWLLPVVLIQAFFVIRNAVFFWQPNPTMQQLNEMNSSLLSLVLSGALNIFQIIVFIMLIFPSAPDNKFGVSATR